MEFGFLSDSDRKVGLSDKFSGWASKTWLGLEGRPTTVVLLGRLEGHGRLIHKEFAILTLASSCYVQIPDEGDWRLATACSPALESSVRAWKCAP
jgi:hypothetical protein